MKLNRAERIAICLTVILAVFTLGFFLGRISLGKPAVVEAATPESTPYLYVHSETEEETLRSAAAEASSSEEPLDTTSSAWTTESEELLDLNRATVAQLEELPGIGPELASRIVNYRDLVGYFLSVEELLEIDGIGEKTIEKIKPYVKVEAAS